MDFASWLVISFNAVGSNENRSSRISSKQVPFLPQSLFVDQVVTGNIILGFTYQSVPSESNNPQGETCHQARCQEDHTNERKQLEGETPFFYTNPLSPRTGHFLVFVHCILDQKNPDHKMCLCTIPQALQKYQFSWLTVISFLICSSFSTNEKN